ncbi:polyprenyl synthetase family protein [Niallia endozanthoxylica]|uniref:Polyprenyl synthetase family protein n=2 Tax=Niallia endozanthoxylica TaxID=2036016 RepID=A0A5J5HRN4_9BACI|nr:polyprenyl synthetase family protein [Niallia endozanthoxylica]
MNEELLINADECYRLAGQKAAHYFKTLSEQVMQQAYVPTLTKDFQAWKQNHIHHYSILSLFSRKRGKETLQGYRHYIQWLNYTGKLDDYLDRSISYIYLRDLGKSLQSGAVKKKIQDVVESLKEHLTHTKDEEDSSDTYNMAGLYRIAQKEGVELAMIWLVQKLKMVSENIPEGLHAEHAQRKLIKIIAGVIMLELEEMSGQESPEERTEKLDRAIRLGYCYGLTYPFIDDLLDSKILSSDEKRKYSNLIRITLTTGSVPELGEWRGKNADYIRFIHKELREAFEYIKANQRKETRTRFFEQAYVFYQSQEEDRNKDLSNEHYTNEEIFLPIILKAASSRLIIRSIISAPMDEGYDSRTFYYGIYNQLADDFADMFGDMKEGAVTPYTYYLKYHEKRPDLINPFELYWTVIFHLIHNVYHSDPKTCEVMLDRAINGLKRFKERIGTGKYNEIMTLLTSGIPKFNRVIQKMVQKADDVDFFDKLLRDHMITLLKNERKEQEEFRDTIKTVRNHINAYLPILRNEKTAILKNPIIDAANYSLSGDGKRLRSIIAWAMGVKEYGLSQSAIIPLLQSLEYMHTASLILDDLPSQDNASTRRGRPTLHQVYHTSIAELTGLFLTQKAVEEQASLESFDVKTVLSLIQYSARKVQDMCEGQAMDLESAGKILTLEELSIMSFYKTGIAFEASLIMPAILANAKESEIAILKKFAYHAGIAFQIKDDLLDVEGDEFVLGKPVGSDAEKQRSTFVTILGIEEAKKTMWEQYCLASEALKEVPQNTSFLKHLLNYMVNRDH